MVLKKCENDWKKTVTKKKLDVAGEVDGQMYPCCVASATYSSVGFCSGKVRG